MGIEVQPLQNESALSARFNSSKACPEIAERVQEFKVGRGR
jgi:hypothetical protein